MRREIIAAASVLALMTGAALAQSTTGTGSAATGGPTATNTNQTGQAQSNQTAAQSQTNLTGGQMASADHLMGKNVYGKDNEKVGEVEDVILDSNGQAKQLVISSGGFLGIGEKQIAVDYNEAKWDQQQDRIQLSNMSRDQVKDMPEFQYSDTTTSLNRNKDGKATNDAAPPAATGAGTGATTGSTGGTATGSGSPSGSTQNKSQ